MTSAATLRDKQRVGDLIAEIRTASTRPWKIMEVCGGQTHAIARYGIETLLPENITLLHGPGCPVCVTPINLIDQAVRRAAEPGTILGSYGDMLRVPGTKGDLLGAKTRGADIRLYYSPLDAVQTAADNPRKQIVFFAVGFETTAPATDLPIKKPPANGLENYSIISAQVLAPPALSMLLGMPDTRPDAFLAPGHVCAITGENDYAALCSRHHIPIAVTGFEPIDLLEGIRDCILQLEHGTAFLTNPYRRVVRPEGNPAALRLMQETFIPVDREWRGIGTIPLGGMDLSPSCIRFDALRRWPDSAPPAPQPPSICRAGDILKGILSPDSCPAFGTACTPLTPLGAPMVSGEGACAACYRYQRTATEHLPQNRKGKQP